jgi:hypothetical protein
MLTRALEWGSPHEDPHGFFQQTTCDCPGRLAPDAIRPAAVVTETLRTKSELTRGLESSFASPPTAGIVLEPVAYFQSGGRAEVELILALRLPYHVPQPRFKSAGTRVGCFDGRRFLQGLTGARRAHLELSGTHTGVEGHLLGNWYCRERRRSIRFSGVGN